MVGGHVVGCDARCASSHSPCGRTKRCYLYLEFLSPAHVTLAGCNCTSPPTEATAVLYLAYRTSLKTVLVDYINTKACDLVTY